MDSILHILIINYNSTDYTINCIDSIKKAKSPHDINVIVVDNCSEDNPTRLFDIHPDIQLINNKENVGYAKAVNQALKTVEGEFVVILNPDTVIFDGFFSLVLDFIERNTEVAIVGPKIIENSGTVQGSARRFPTFATSIFGRRSPFTRLFPNNPFTKREFVSFNCEGNKPLEVDWVSGACMVARRSALESVGGFDERFFLYWEDTDLCKRLKDSGWKIIYLPCAAVYHHTGMSSEKAPIFAIYQFHKSCYFLFKKHAKWPMKLMNPIALMGLSVRCIFAILFRLCKCAFSTSNAVVGSEMIQDSERNHTGRKLKILRVVSRLNIGGPSIHCSILQQGFNNHLFASKLVTGSLSEHEGDMSYLIKNEQASILKLPELQREIDFFKDIRAFIKLLRVIHKENPDIVHSHMAKAGALLRGAVFLHNLFSRKKIKCVHTFHGHVLEGYFSPIKSKIILFIERMLAKATNAIIAISQTQKWELSDKYRLAEPERIRVINLGFDLSTFASKNGVGDFRAKHGVDDNDLLIGIVGRLAPIKNHRLFLDAAKRIKAGHSNRSIKFIIVGDGELRGQLEAYAEQIDIRGDVIFYGWSKEVKTIYDNLDMLLLTSDNEGTPVSIIEAMASGVPVVTTGVGGIKDLLGVIERSVNGRKNYSVCERGILCPKGDAEAVAAGVGYLLENDNRQRIDKARDFVLANYTDKHLVDRVKRLYESLI